nr:Deoxyuridine 5'-triphosphate nucleotidohydrolase [Pandoravirus belohorizontensis]
MTSPSSPLPSLTPTPCDSGVPLSDSFPVAAAVDASHSPKDETCTGALADDGATGERKRARPDPADANPMVLKCKRMHEDAVLPRRGTPGAAGYDLWAVGTTTVPARGRAQVRTGLAVAIPTGYYGRVAPRSSLAVRGIDVGAGVIDADYRGEVGVVLLNHTDADYVVQGEARIAQLLIEKIAQPEPEWVDSLDDTERGSGGFGSTGR